MRTIWTGIVAAGALSLVGACGGGVVSGAGGGGGSARAELICPSGFADCDGDPASGCEAALRTSVASCGACGKACSAPASATALCVDGACSFACEPGTADCDGYAANGCEVVLTTDVANCGACGEVCEKTCSRGTCDVTVLAEAQAGPVVVAVDATSVYWLNYGPQGKPSGAVMRVEKSGGAPAALVSGLVNPGALLLDGDDVYWSSADGSIQRVKKAGGATTVLAQQQSGPVALAITGGALYWANTGTPPAFADGSIVGLDLQDPSAVPVPIAMIPGGLDALTVVGGDLYATVFGSGQNPDGSLWRVALSSPGGAPERVASALASPRAIVGNAGGVWFAAEKAVLATPVGATTPPRSIVPELTAQPLLLALDGERVWWTTQSGTQGKIVSAGLDGSSPRTRAHGLSQPRGIAVDESYVYWTQVSNGMAATGEVLRAPVVGQSMKP